MFPVEATTDAPQSVWEEIRQKETQQQMSREKKKRSLQGRIVFVSAREKRKRRREDAALKQEREKKESNVEYTEYMEKRAGHGTRRTNKNRWKPSTVVRRGSHCETRSTDEAPEGRADGRKGRTFLSHNSLRTYIRRATIKRTRDTRHKVQVSWKTFAESFLFSISRPELNVCWSALGGNKHLV